MYFSLLRRWTLRRVKQSHPLKAAGSYCAGWLVSSGVVPGVSGFKFWSCACMNIELTWSPTTCLHAVEVEVEVPTRFIYTNGWKPVWDTAHACETCMYGKLAAADEPSLLEALVSNNLMTSTVFAAGFSCVLLSRDASISISGIGTDTRV